MPKRICGFCWRISGCKNKTALTSLMMIMMTNRGLASCSSRDSEADSRSVCLHSVTWKIDQTYSSIRPNFGLNSSLRPKLRPKFGHLLDEITWIFLSAKNKQYVICDVSALIVCCIAAANIKLCHWAANVIMNYCYTLKQQLSPSLKTLMCFLLKFVCNALVMNIN